MIVSWLLGDLNASEITMGDEERIKLMLMVKEGSISKDEAVEAVGLDYIFYIFLLHILWTFYIDSINKLHFNIISIPIGFIANVNKIRYINILYSKRYAIWLKLK